MPKTYKVLANGPTMANAKNWDYPTGYFPRKFKYKRDAITAAKDAVRKGATMARVECPGGGELDYRPEPFEGTPTPPLKLMGKMREIPIPQSTPEAMASTDTENDHGDKDMEMSMAACGLVVKLAHSMAVSQQREDIAEQLYAIVCMLSDINRRVTRS